MRQDLDHRAPGAARAAGAVAEHRADRRAHLHARSGGRVEGAHRRAARHRPAPLRVRRRSARSVLRRLRACAAAGRVRGAAASCPPATRRRADPHDPLVLSAHPRRSCAEYGLLAATAPDRAFACVAATDRRGLVALRDRAAGRVAGAFGGARSPERRASGRAAVARTRGSRRATVARARGRVARTARSSARSRRCGRPRCAGGRRCALRLASRARFAGASAVAGAKSAPLARRTPGLLRRLACLQRFPAQGLDPLGRAYADQRLRRSPDAIRLRTAVEGRSTEHVAPRLWPCRHRGRDRSARSGRSEAECAGARRRRTQLRRHAGGGASSGSRSRPRRCARRPDAALLAARDRRRVPGHRPGAVGHLRSRVCEGGTGGVRARARGRPQAGDLQFSQRRRAHLSARARRRGCPPSPARKPACQRRPAGRVEHPVRPRESFPRAGHRMAGRKAWCACSGRRTPGARRRCRRPHRGRSAAGRRGGHDRGTLRRHRHVGRARGTGDRARDPSSDRRRGRRAARDCRARAHACGRRHHSAQPARGRRGGGRGVERECVPVRDRRRPGAPARRGRESFGSGAGAWCAGRPSAGSEPRTGARAAVR